MKGNVSKKNKFLKAYRDGKGIIVYACNKSGISRKTFYNWKESDDDFRQKCDEIDEETIDIVESKLLTAINDDNLTATIFYLKTKGRKRGYVEMVDQNVNINPFEELMKSLPEIPDK